MQKTVEQPDLSIKDIHARVQALSSYVKEHPRRITRGLINFHGSHERVFFSVSEPDRSGVVCVPGRYPVRIGISVHFLLGHQVIGTLCDYGAVDENGQPRFADLHEWFEFFDS
jgi:hypothetical protein